jgi:DNA-binding GntR family transcriptional regulator
MLLACKLHTTIANMVLEGGPEAPAPASAAARAYAHIKERLLDGRLAGGTLLSENELAQRLRMSRTPVRQAFVQLEGEGLLELYPRRGALVVPISGAEAEDVLEARLLIEQHCARRAATAGRPLSAELEELLDAQEHALAAGGAGFAELDRRFHRAIVAAAGNAILTRQYDALRDRQERIAAAMVARDPARAQRFVADHREIAAALERGDADAAAALTAAHVDCARAVMRRLRG